MAHALRYTEADYRSAASAIAHRLRGWLPNDKGALCLDVACGAGEMLYMLKTFGYRNITGIDVSPEQVQTAQRIWPNVLEIDAKRYLDNHPGEFDLITAFDIVEHFAKDELFEFLDGLFRALRPGGVAIFQTPNAESPWGMKVRYGDLTHEIGFDPLSLAHVLKLVGFDACEPRECGPYVHGPTSLIRVLLWKALHAGLALWNLAETGNRGSGVYTRVFIMRAVKPPPS